MKNLISLAKELLGKSATGYTIYSVAGILIISVFSLISCSNENEETVTDAVYVADENGGTVSVIDALKNKKVTAIDLTENSVMFMPHNVQVAPDGNSVWVTGMPMSENVSEQVIVINPETNKIIKRINLGTEQHLAHVVLDSESAFAFVIANESNQVIKINAKSLQEVLRYDLGADHEPHGIRYHNGKLFVANMGAKSVSIVDVATSLIDEIPLGGIAVQTAVLPDGSFAFVSLYDTKEVARIDLQTKTVTKISLPAEAKGPIQLYPTPNSKLLYVCDQGGIGDDPVSDKVFVIDVNANSVTATITAGSKTHGVVVNNTGTKVYVTNSDGNTVSVIDVATQKVTGTVGVGLAPNGIACRHSMGSTFEGMP
ncbi:YncE family protein [bacterium]|nr:YncE family protein [bacterium]